MDFLKANPHVTMEDYLWKWTIPQIKLATYDSTHIEYTKNKDKTKKGKSKHKIAKEDVIRLDSAESVQQFLGQYGNKANI